MSDMGKSCEYDKMNDIFEGIDDDDMDAIPIEHIDLEEIDQESKNEAKSIIETLTKLYCNEEFIKNNPNFKRRIDSELDSLRLLNKMRKADEKAQDKLCDAISENSNNASLYKALSEIQKTIISITTKINEIKQNLHTIIKNYQTEINFEQAEQEYNPTEEQEGAEVISLRNPICRGTKEFITQMQQQTN